MIALRPGLLVAVLAGAPLSSPVWADTLSGRVEDVALIGVAGVNIDLEDMISGDPIVIFNGGSDINGDFNLTAPAGVYRVIFIPPGPPTTTHLITIVENVVVSGISAMGTTQLLPGVSFAGRLVDSGASPVADIDLDFFDVVGNELTIPGDRSDALGNFLVAVPAGSIGLEIRPSQQNLPLYAPQRIELNLVGNTMFGDIVVRDGFVLSATFERTNGNPVQGSNSDVVDVVTGDELFTPGDGSDANGFMDVVVPAGTYDLETCPPNGSMLAGSRVSAVIVGSDTDLGVVNLATGVVLSGQLLSSVGLPVVNGDVDVRVQSTQEALVTCNDNTDAGGNYAVLVPDGNYTVIFSLPSDPSMGSARVKNANVSGATTVDGRLPGCECTRYCSPLAHSGGFVATIHGSGSIVAGDQSFQLIVRDLPGNVPGLFFFGPNQLQAPFGEGRRCVGGAVKRIQPPAFGMMGVAQRNLNFSAPSVANNIVMGANLNFQFWYRDGQGGPAGFNLTDGLNVVWQ